jgi:hypothetical protein
MSLRFLLWSRFVEPTTLGALAQNLGRPCLPPPSISLLSLALALTGTALSVVSIVPPDEPAVPGVRRTALGRPCLPPPSISLQSLALALTGTALSVVSIVPPDEPAVPAGVRRTAVDPEYQEALRPRIHVLCDTVECSELGLKGSGIACLWDGRLFCEQVFGGDSLREKS